jgi:cardiolipin synthase
MSRHGYGPFRVHYLGKAATFCLLYAFPLLLLGTYHGPVADIARAVAWAFTIWGSALYLYAGAVYLRQAAQLIRTAGP